MAGDLVTVAEFADSVEAHVARSRLEAEGIRGFLSDEEIVAMAWHLTNAVGTIKLQVADRDAVAALAILSESPADERIITEAALGASAEGEEFETMSGAEAALDDESPRAESPREADAYRALRCAVLGLLFWPLQLYVLWILLQVFNSEEPLGGIYERYAWVAAAISVLFIITIYAVLTAGQ